MPEVGLSAGSPETLTKMPNRKLLGLLLDLRIIQSQIQLNGLPGLKPERFRLPLVS
ncbi:MAG: hypothetical protein AAGH40_09285 [Verrucomicrobiota bacterium]